ncbi:MAG TPA: guanylate kinase [Chloroflexia bacterium]|nr:guanylate kinase [Chloroflexia bacterium]
MGESEQGSRETPPSGQEIGAGGAQGAVSVVAGLPEPLEKLVAAQGPSPEIEEFIDRPTPALLVVLTGPSGVGKDVTLQRMRELGVPFHYVVTVTTREKRPGEIEGVHYRFVTRQAYEEMKARGELLEDSEVYGNHYGVPRSEVIEPLRRGEDVIMKPDVQGAAKVKELEPGAIFIFLAPPSMKELATRLYYRKTEDPDELKIRLRVARQEMQALRDFDYVVVNHHKRLDETVEAIKTIIRAEKLKVHPCRIRLADRE